MATSLISTGVQFADSTIQTTAAVAGGGSAEIVASGALSDGSKVVINANGTVSVVGFAALNPPTAGTPVVFENAQSDFNSAVYDANQQRVVIAYRDRGNSDYGTAIVGSVSGTSISFGTPVVFESASTSFISTVYDSGQQKVVISYRDVGNSNYGTAIVGTVSGTSISLGTAVVFESDSTSEISMAYDSTEQKIVVSYRDHGNSNYGTSIVGTVSGTSISFGTPVVFESAFSVNTSTVYDTNQQKVVIFYVDAGNSDYGTAIVGTVSGTTISFGTAVVFESATSEYVSATYDSNAQKVVTAYRDQGNSSYGTAIVGTVSGTSISFGSAVVFETGNTSHISTAYDLLAQKVVITYRDVGNSEFGTAIVGTVSGTSISFGTPVVFESASTSSISTVYDSGQQKTVVAYEDEGNSGYGTSVVLQNTSQNLTAENYIGISDGAYADTATATIQLAGAVDDAQTSLTAGQSYFVQTDGTLGLTPDTPSVFAGTAVSSTKLIIKG
jgi:hypothetical protein